MPAETVFVYAGRFEKIKGVLLLADAWLRTADDKKTKRLLLAGAWNKSSCGNQVHEKLSGREDVLFLDNLDQASLASLYKKTHCVIVPSQWIETGPLVIHEAVASGCDVITSDIGGQNELADIYAARVTKFKNGDVVSLANAINHYRAGTTDISGQVIDEAMHYRQVADLFML